jgi:hypothetical protein
MTASESFGFDAGVTIAEKCTGKGIGYAIGQGLEKNSYSFGDPPARLLGIRISKIIGARVRRWCLVAANRRV